MLERKPAVREGEWVARGDLLVQGSSAIAGELALGKNLMVAYMPWEGYNFEDAILLSERVIYDHVYTSVHVKQLEVLLKNDEVT